MIVVVVMSMVVVVMSVGVGVVLSAVELVVVIGGHSGDYGGGLVMVLVMVAGGWL